VLPGLGVRRHRQLTMPAGLLLFVCLFLPAVRSCGSDVYPVEAPLLWHPYIYGLLLAVAAVATTLRGVRAATIALRVAAYVCIGVGLVLATQTAWFVIELLLGGVLLGVIGVRGVAEKRLALTGIIMSGASLLWFGMWATSSGALIGIYVSLGASIFLLAGSLLWLSEI